MDYSVQEGCAKVLKRAMIPVFKPFGLLRNPRGQNTPFKLDLISVISKPWSRSDF